MRKIYGSSSTDSVNDPKAFSRGHVLSQLGKGAAIRVAGQVVIWASTFFIIRLLQPEDFGLLALGMMVLGMSAFISELGLGASVVQMRELKQAALQAVFGLILAINLGFILLVNLFSGPIAGFFDAPQLASVLNVLILALIFNAVAVVPSGLLVRNMRMAVREMVELGASFLGNMTTLVLALMDFGVWALVIGQLTIQGSRAAMVWHLSPFPHWPSFRFGQAVEHFRFGTQRAINQVCWKTVTYSDSFFIGRFLSKADLGAYSIAMKLAGLPLDKFASLIRQVGFSAFARIQDDRKKVNDYLLKTTEIAALTSLPVFAGLNLVAPDLVIAVLGEKWRSAIFPVQMICLIQPLFLLSNVLGSAVDGIGKPQINTLAAALALAILPLGFFIGSQYGLERVVLVWPIGMALWFAATLIFRLNALGISASLYLARISRPLLATAMMWAGVVLCSPVIPVEAGPWLRVAIIAAMGALFFTVTTMVIMGKNVMEIFRWFKAARSQRAPKVGAGR